MAGRPSPVVGPEVLHDNRAPEAGVEDVGDTETGTLTIVPLKYKTGRMVGRAALMRGVTKRLKR